MHTENYLESTENHLSSNRIFPRTHYSADSPRDSDENGTSRNNEEFEDRIIFMSMFNDID